MNYQTVLCPHVRTESIDPQVLGEAHPSLAACAGCAHLSHGGIARGFDCLRELPILPISPGQTLSNLIELTAGGQFSVWVDPTHPGLKVLLSDGRPVETLFVIRDSADGPILMFHGDSMPWWQRVVHRDHLGVGFGMSLPDDGLAGVHDRDTVWTRMMASLRSGSLRMGAKHVLRLR